MRDYKKVVWRNLRAAAGGLFSLLQLQVVVEGGQGTGETCRNISQQTYCFYIFLEWGASLIYIQVIALHLHLLGFLVGHTSGVSSKGQTFSSVSSSISSSEGDLPLQASCESEIVHRQVLEAQRSRKVVERIQIGH